jgi:hypothetical protein
VEPDPRPAAPPAAVLPVQTERILADLAEGLEESLAAGSPASLRRIEGAALEMRTAEFAMAGADPEEVTVEDLGVEFTGTIVPTTKEWPRSFIAVTAPGPGGAQYLYLLTQDTARSAYTMRHWVRLLAGVTLPLTAPADVGSAVLDPASPGDLSMAPEAALAAYVAAKDDPTSPQAGVFAAADPAREAWAGLVDRWSAALESIDGEVGSASSVVPGSVYAMATADGGAIVTGIVRSRLTLRIPDNTQGQSFSLAPYFGALGAGSTTVSQAATIEFASPVALGVPSGASEAKVTVLGVSQVPVAAETQ